MEQLFRLHVRAQERGFVNDEQGRTGEQHCGKLHKRFFRQGQLADGRIRFPAEAHLLHNGLRCAPQLFFVHKTGILPPQENVFRNA